MRPPVDAALWRPNQTAPPIAKHRRFVDGDERACDSLEFFQAESGFRLWNQPFKHSRPKLLLQPKRPGRLLRLPSSNILLQQHLLPLRMLLVAELDDIGQHAAALHGFRVDLQTINRLTGGRAGRQAGRQAAATAALIQHA